MPIKFEDETLRAPYEDPLSSEGLIEESRKPSLFASGMKKAKSVDFGRLLKRKSSSLLNQTGEDARQLASQFSRRAARDGYFICRPCLPSRDEDELSPCKRQANASNNAPELWSGSDVSSLSEEERQTPLTVRIPVGTITLGKISLIFLLVATVMELLVCQVHQLEAHDIYDALSSDVIRPAFRYTAANSHKLRSSLGSAAISSVTDCLSPILPFTGGLDLRREDYWETQGNIIQKINAVVKQVEEFVLSQGTSTVEETTTNEVSSESTKSSKGSRKALNYVSAISASQPLVPLDLVGELTLAEVSELFHYAVECNKDDFNEARFLNSLSSQTKRTVQAMKLAMAQSRGNEVKLSKASKTSLAGSVDALAFSAAMRVFAEWRIIRQNPDGYKGFSVGMTLGHKDVVQNVFKIETAVHGWLDHQANTIDIDQDLNSPTLRDLLEYEIAMNINPANRLPRLNDKTSGMGLLWVRRQLQYQTQLFDNTMSQEFSSTAKAVEAAYKEVYDKYHGWTVQKIFTYSFQSAPTAEVIFRNMNPLKLKEAMDAAQRMTLSGNVDESESVPSEETEKKEENPVQAFFNHIGREWEKITSHIAGKSKEKNLKQKPFTVRGGAHLSSEEIESYLTTKMVKDAHKNIAEYVKIAHPLLDDLAVLFDEMNMNDPTKV